MWNVMLDMGLDSVALTQRCCVSKVQEFESQYPVQPPFILQRLGDDHGEVNCVV